MIWWRIPGCLILKAARCPASVAVEHDAVEFWPYEWPFYMLRDAALLQLRLLESSVSNGWMMKDATPFNV